MLVEGSVGLNKSRISKNSQKLDYNRINVVATYDDESKAIFENLGSKPSMIENFLSKTSNAIMRGDDYDDCLSVACFKCAELVEIIQNHIFILHECKSIINEQFRISNSIDNKKLKLHQ